MPGKPHSMPFGSTILRTFGLLAVLGSCVLAADSPAQTAPAQNQNPPQQQNPPANTTPQGTGTPPGTNQPQTPADKTGKQMPENKKPMSKEAAGRDKNNQKTNSEDQKSTQQKPKSAANPLILPTPSDADNTAAAAMHDHSGLRPGSQTTNLIEHDYTHPTRPAVIKAKRLKAFGYDYFSPARDAVDALRMYYQGKAPKAGGDISSVVRPKSADVGSLDLNSSSIISGSSTTSVPLGGSPASGASSSSDVAAALAGGAAAQGSALSANGVSPLLGPQSLLQTNGTQSSGTSGADNSIAVAAPPPPASANGTQLYNLPENYGPIDVRTSVFGPIQGQYHNILANPPANYQLGPGDVITIQFSSPTRDAQTLHRELDATGRVNMQGLGMVSLLGKTVSGAEKTLETELRRYFKSVQVTVTMDQVRSVSVSVVGHAYEPGAYSVPAVIATAYNVLWWAGGPTEDGSLRDIEVRRQGKTVGVIDMYKYELGGGNADDIQLQAGDVLYVPARLSSVAVQGEVRTQAIYELKPGDTLQDAITYTGGVKASAVKQRVQINTVEPGASRIIRDIDLGSPAGQKTAVYDGDVVEVLSVRNYLTNSVTIEGAVDQPSDYALTPNMRVSDLVNRARGLLDAAYPVAELHRWNADNTDTLTRVDLEKALTHDPANDLTLARWDRIKVYTRDEVAWTGRHTITIDGQVRRHGVYTASHGMHVSDALRMAGGPLPNAYLDRAVLMHQHEDGPPTMEFVDIGAIIRGDTAKDPLVLDNDHLAVYAVGQAQFTPDHIVVVSGEVVAPGPYPRAENMSLTNLLAVAGGFKPDAGTVVVVTHARRVIDAPNAPLIKTPITFDASGRCRPQDDVKLEDGDVVTVQGKGGFVDAVQVVTVLGAVESPGPMPITAKDMRLSDAIKLAGGLRKEAYPLGAEFHRDPNTMLTNTQESMAQSIGRLRDLLNGTAYQREAAKSRLDIITATGEAQADTLTTGLLGGLAGGAAAAAAIPNAAAGAVGTQLANGQVPVTPARLMGDGHNDLDGAVAINLPKALLKPGGHEDVILKDGDVITVPETPTTVEVIGAVYHPSAVVWEPEKGIGYYVNRAGGYTFDAAKDGMEVIRAGGGIVPAKRAGKLLPGDVILVPTKPIAASISRHQNALNDFFKSLTSSVLIYGIAKSVFGL